MSSSLSTVTMGWALELRALELNIEALGMVPDKAFVSQLGVAAVHLYLIRLDAQVVSFSFSYYCSSFSPFVVIVVLYDYSVRNSEFLCG